ncbi:hypothetical protein KAR91_51370 [Candidatus Pacearchaeota archaeon]|nr:hypothetical protein [Candidatus Pacearchaeota archaeon]
MKYNGKVTKKITTLFPEETLEKSVVKFFDHYYVACGLSLKEIVDYILSGTTHSVLSLMAKSYGIDYIAGKGGNFHKYNKAFHCDCGFKKTLRLLVVNKEKHLNLVLKCDRCKVGDMV